MKKTAHFKHQHKFRASIGKTVLQLSIIPVIHARSSLHCFSLPSFGDSLLLLITCSILQRSCSVSTSELYESDEHDDLLAKGILFHEETKILLAEKFINVEFLVPYPRYRFSVREELSPLFGNQSKMWEMSS